MGGLAAAAGMPPMDPIAATASAISARSPVEIAPQPMELSLDAAALLSGGAASAPAAAAAGTDFVVLSRELVLGLGVGLDLSQE